MSSVALITPTLSAQAALRALLAGESAPQRPADQWTPVLAELAAIADLTARRRAFDAAARADPALRTLLNGSPAAPGKTVVTATDVLRMQFPDLQWIVPGLLPPGYTLFAGRPKQGKSWLALQLALAVATGGQALGEKVEHGNVLVCALEDGYRRLKDRMTAQGWPDPCDAVQYVISLDELGGPLDGSGLPALEQRIVEHNLRLVVVDTLARAFRISDMNDMAKTTAASTASRTWPSGAASPSSSSITPTRPPTTTSSVTPPGPPALAPSQTASWSSSASAAKAQPPWR